MNYVNEPSLYFYDPSNGDVKLQGSHTPAYAAYYYWTPPVYSPQVDDVDGRIWSFQGHYIIGQGEDDVIIAETGITPPVGSGYVDVYLYVLGRTFVVCFEDWNTSYQWLYAVHYPGSIVIESI